MKYKTIVIDLPWNVGFPKLKRRPNQKQLPYKTMTDEECKKFPINDFADNECGLFMWVPMSKVPLAFEILKIWGFTYSVTMTWIKDNTFNFLGFGRNSELCIFAYKGKFNIRTDEGHYIPLAFNGKNRKHSQKPDEFYEIIRNRTPEPRIDIFARRRHFGFNAYGNEVEDEIQLPITQHFCLNQVMEGDYDCLVCETVEKERQS